MVAVDTDDAFRDVVGVGNRILLGNVDLDFRIQNGCNAIRNRFAFDFRSRDEFTTLRLCDDRLFVVVFIGNTQS